jgi:transposase
MKNRYASRSRISEAKTRALVRCVAADLAAVQTARITDLDRNAVNRFHRALRDRIAAVCEAERAVFGGVEVPLSADGCASACRAEDESTFGPKNVPGNRGRGAGGKTKVFGISLPDR